MPPSQPGHANILFQIVHYYPVQKQRLKRQKSITIKPRNSIVIPPQTSVADYDEVMKHAQERAMQKDSYTLEEAYNLIMTEIKAVYDGTPVV